MFRHNGVQLSEFSQGVIIRFFAEHGDALSDDAWRTFHRWYHAVEMKKCVADFEEGLELEYTTVEFAAAQALHAIRAELEAKRKDACLEFRCEV